MIHPNQVLPIIVLCLVMLYFLPGCASLRQDYDAKDFFARWDRQSP